jgi:tRNA C32,U32 (ribose-2'-O)-methylase TrmJ
LDFKDLRIKEIIENCKILINESPTIEEGDNKEIDEYNIWKAYSWIEYSILLVRLKRYNLLDEPSSLKEQKKTKTTKVDEKIMIQQARDLLLDLNYKDEEKMLDSLRNVRDLLKRIVKNRKKKNTSENKKQE